MATFNPHRVTSLPPTPLARSVYFSKETGKERLRCYVIGADGSVHELVDEGFVNTKIAEAVASIGAIEIVADITARDALTLTSNAIALVIDATGDATVDVGAATYAYTHATTSWTKISEVESMDLSLSWESITGKPTSTAAQIDDAVAKAHTHANATELSNIGQDASGDLTYNGALPKIAWQTESW